MNTFSSWASFSILTIAILISTSSAAALARGQLRGDITTAEIIAHDASLKGHLPKGQYNVVVPPYESSDFVITGGYVADQECWKLVEMNQANSISQGVQKKYAKILGFEGCRATPIVKGLISRSCKLAFQCNHQQHRFLVSSFVNVSREVDPIRGGSPIALMLQAFPNNGEDVKSPVFQEIVVDELE